MGIYIKGLKMPITCDDCIVPLSKCDFLMKRADACPLVAVPDHGDLIDRDAFIKVNREYLCKDCERRKGVKNGRKRTLYEIGGVPCRACGVEDMFEYLDDAPVVIPAERSEE